MIVTIGVKILTHVNKQPTGYKTKDIKDALLNMITNHSKESLQEFIHDDVHILKQAHSDVPIYGRAR